MHTSMIVVIYYIGILHNHEQEWSVRGLTNDPIALG
jgi:hypothetical protein